MDQLSHWLFAAGLQIDWIYIIPILYYLFSLKIFYLWFYCCKFLSQSSLLTKTENKNHTSGLSLSLELPVSLIFTPVTNVLPIQWTVSTKGKFTCKIKGQTYLAVGAMGYWPYWQPCTRTVHLTAKNDFLFLHFSKSCKVCLRFKTQLKFHICLWWIIIILWLQSTKLNEMYLSLITNTNFCIWFK